MACGVTDPDAVDGATPPATAGAMPDEPASDWRRLTAVFAIAGFVETVGFGHFFAFLPILVTQLGVTGPEAATTVALLSTSALVLGLPLAPFWGAWADRYSRKAIIVRSAAVEFVLWTLLAVAGQIWQVFVVVPLIGLVLGNTGVMLAEITDRTPRRRLGFAISLVGIAAPLGISLGPGFGGVLADTFGVQALFLLDAGLSGLVVVMLMTLYHERPDRPRSSYGVMTLVRRSLAAVYRTPLARAMFIAYFFLLLGQRVVFPFLAIYVQSINGPRMLATTVGIVAGAYGVAASIGSPVAGRFSDRIGHRRVYQAAVMIVVVCFVGAWLARDMLPFAVAYAAYGIGFATATAMLYTLLATGLPADVRSPILNLALVPLYVSGIVGPLISAQVLGWSGGDVRPLWLIGAVFAGISAIPPLTAALTSATLGADDTDQSRTAVHA